VCVCVRERERERERGLGWDLGCLRERYPTITPKNHNSRVAKVTVFQL